MSSVLQYWREGARSRKELRSLILKCCLYNYFDVYEYVHCKVVTCPDEQEEHQFFSMLLDTSGVIHVQDRKNTLSKTHFHSNVELRPSSFSVDLVKFIDPTVEQC